MYGVWIEYCEEMQRRGCRSSWWMGVLERPIRTDCSMDMVIVGYPFFEDKEDADFIAQWLNARKDDTIATVHEVELPQKPVREDVKT